MAAFHQLQCMRSFLAVAEHGSFSRAAHALRIGAASVSEHVGTLEQHLGTRLLLRTTRSVQLTHEGALYLEMCRDILPRIAEMDSKLAGSGTDQRLSGLLRIEMSEGIDGFLLEPIQQFQAMHPGLTIHVLRSTRQFDMADTRADIAIRNVAPLAADDRKMVSRRLGQSRTVYLASPRYLAENGRPVSPRDLLEHRCIGYVDPYSGRLWEWHFANCAGNGGGPPFSLDVPCPLALSQGHLRRQAAVDGQGIINDLDHFTRPLVDSGKLTRILADWSIPQPICHISYQRSHRNTPRINGFVDWLEGWFIKSSGDACK